MMQEIQFVDAIRSQSRLRMGVMGPAGAGKTMSLLLLAYGITGDWSKVFVIDTERGSAALYDHLCGKGPKFKVFTMEPPYSPERYRMAIKAAEEAGALGIIVDSLSHAWEGEGGALDKVDAAASRSGNSYTAWKDVTPEHRAMVDAILQSPCHIGVAMRAKQEYVLEKNEKGKMEPRRVGLAPVQRAGMEFEFTVFFDIDESHHALASKDRTGLFDQQRFKPSKETGQKLKNWLGSAAAKAPAPAAAPAAPAPAPAPAPAAPQQQAPAPAAAPDSLTNGFTMAKDFSGRIERLATKAEGAALWDEVTKAQAIIGDEAMNELLSNLRKKAPTLS